MDERKHSRTRIGEALSALREGEELSRLRVRRRVLSEVGAGRRRGHRVAAMLGLTGASVAAAVLIGAALAGAFASDGSSAAGRPVEFAVVMEMLGSSQEDGGSAESLLLMMLAETGPPAR